MVVSAPWFVAVFSALSVRSTLPLAAVWCFAVAERDRSRRHLFAGGALLGLAFLWYQDAPVYVGIGLAVAAILWAVRDGRPVRPLLTVGARTVAAGAALVLVPAAIAFAAVGSFGGWLYYTVVYPNRVYTHRSGHAYLHSVIDDVRHASPPDALYKAIFYVAVYALPFLLVLAAAAALTRCYVKNNSPSQRVTITTLAIYAAAQLRLLYLVTDEAKLRDTLPPTVVLVSVMAIRSFAGLRVRPPAGGRMRLAAAAAIIGLAAVYALQSQIRDLDHVHSSQTSSAGGALSGLPFVASSPTTTAAQLETLVETVRTQCPGGPLLALPDSPLLYHLTDRRSASCYDYLDPTYTTSQVDERMAEDVARTRPPCVVLSSRAFGGNGPTGAQMAPLLYAYLSAHYEPLTTVGPFQIERRSGTT